MRAGRQGGAENHVAGGAWDVAAVPDHRARRSQRVDRFPHRGGAPADGRHQVARRTQRSQRLPVRVDRQGAHDLGPVRVAFQEIAQGGGVPAQHEAQGIPGLGEQRVERPRGLGTREAFRPGEDDRADGVELENALGCERSQVLGRARDDVDGSFLEKGNGSAEAGDGVHAQADRGPRRPLGGGRVVQTYHEGRDRRRHELPDRIRLLDGGRNHEHHGAAAIERGARCTHIRHRDLGCQRAEMRLGW